jgi:type II secretory pathway pseudopilin PulG
MSPSGQCKWRQAVHGREESAGFTMVELMVATAVMMIFMSAAVFGVLEAQRGINTVAAREADANQAQALVDQMMAQVRAASGAAVYGCNSQCTQLWLYNANPPPTWPYSCTVWVYNASTTPAQLEAFATNSTVTVGTTPTLSQISAAASVRDQLSGVAAPSGFSGIFQTFGGYPGLVDVDLTVQYATSAGQSSSQEASKPSQIETEADDVNISSSSGLPALSATNPGSTCY